MYSQCKSGGIMTQSERICNEIGSRFLCKDFVYENLKYYNDKNNKIELCDGLFKYCGTYIALQIKERDKSKTTKTNEEWLNEVVYGDAVSQIIKTINGHSFRINQRNKYCLNI